MKTSNAFRPQQHRLEGIVVSLLLAAWVVGSTVTFGLQGAGVA